MVNDRGQLLLVGAIVIAITILGTVVLLNDVQYADSVGSRSGSHVLDEAERTQEMVVRDVRHLAAALNSSAANCTKALPGNVSVYTNYTRNMMLSSGVQTVNVTLNESATPDVASEACPSSIAIDYRYRSPEISYNRTITIEPVGGHWP